MASCVEFFQTRLSSTGEELPWPGPFERRPSGLSHVNELGGSRVQLPPVPQAASCVLVQSLLRQLCLQCKSLHCTAHWPRRPCIQPKKNEDRKAPWSCCIISKFDEDILVAEESAVSSSLVKYCSAGFQVEDADGSIVIFDAEEFQRALGYAKEKKLHPKAVRMRAVGTWVFGLCDLYDLLRLCRRSEGLTAEDEEVMRSCFAAYYWVPVYKLDERQKLTRASNKADGNAKWLHLRTQALRTEIKLDFPRDQDLAATLDTSNQVHERGSSVPGFMCLEAPRDDSHHWGLHLDVRRANDVVAVFKPLYTPQFTQRAQAQLLSRYSQILDRKGKAKVLEASEGKSKQQELEDKSQRCQFKATFANDKGMPYEAGQVRAQAEPLVADGNSAALTTPFIDVSTRMARSLITVRYLDLDRGPWLNSIYLDALASGPMVYPGAFSYFLGHSLATRDEVLLPRDGLLVTHQGQELRGMASQTQRQLLASLWQPFPKNSTWRRDYPALNGIELLSEDARCDSLKNVDDQTVEHWCRLHCLCAFLKQHDVSFIKEMPRHGDSYYILRNPVDGRGSTPVVRICIRATSDLSVRVHPLLLRNLGLDFDGDHLLLIAQEHFRLNLYQELGPQRPVYHLFDAAGKCRGGLTDHAETWLSKMTEIPGFPRLSALQVQELLAACPYGTQRRLTPVADFNNLRTGDLIRLNSSQQVARVSAQKPDLIFFDVNETLDINEYAQRPLTASDRLKRVTEEMTAEAIEFLPYWLQGQRERCDLLSRLRGRSVGLLIDAKVAEEMLRREGSEDMTAEALPWAETYREYGRLVYFTENLLVDILDDDGWTIERKSIDAQAQPCYLSTTVEHIIGAVLALLLPRESVLTDGADATAVRFVYRQGALDRFGSRFSMHRAPLNVGELEAKLLAARGVDASSLTHVERQWCRFALGLRAQSMQPGLTGKDIEALTAQLVITAGDFTAAYFLMILESLAGHGSTMLETRSQPIPEVQHARLVEEIVRIMNEQLADEREDGCVASEATAQMNRSARMKHDEELLTSLAHSSSSRRPCTRCRHCHLSSHDEDSLQAWLTEITGPVF